MANQSIAAKLEILKHCNLKRFLPKQLPEGNFYTLFFLSILLGGIPTLAVCQTASHPLLPGVRSSSLRQLAWPRTLHDDLATGFSPLVLGMDHPPVAQGRLSFGGDLTWVRVLQTPGRADQLLIADSRLRLVQQDGTVLWSTSLLGSPIFYGDLAASQVLSKQAPQDGNDDATWDGSTVKRGRLQSPPNWNGSTVKRGRLQSTVTNPNALVLVAGAQIRWLDPETGKLIWTHRFDPPHAHLRVAIADILPEKPGMEAAIFQSHAENGCVVNFPPDGKPEIIWQRPVVVPGEYPERYDHGCDIRLDLSDPEKPLIWNVRRYRCRSFDARTGEMTSTLEYEIGGAQRRNYGPWSLGRDSQGNRLIAVVAERVQIHVHAIQTLDSGKTVLAWEKYYGEVYKKSFGVALETLTISDLDGDGATEIAYSVRDPDHDFRSFVRVRDAATGTIEWEMADAWGVTAFSNLGTDRLSGLIVCPAPGGLMAKTGMLKLLRFPADTQTAVIGQLQNARISPVNTVDVDGRELLLISSTDPASTKREFYDIEHGKLNLVFDFAPEPNCNGPFHAILQPATGNLAEGLFVSKNNQGQLAAFTWKGKEAWHLNLTGGRLPSISAADFDQDGKAELVTIETGQQVGVSSFQPDGTFCQLDKFPHVASWGYHSPLLYDLESNGKWCLVAPAIAADGNLLIRAYRHDFTLLWETRLEVPAEDLHLFIAHAGRFLPGGLAAVTISIRDQRLTHDGSYLLDGQTGEQLWSKQLYHDGTTTMPCRAQGVPTAFDIDDDGLQEIGFDMLSYMAYLNGEDGSFALLRHSPNIRSEQALYAGHLYNTFCPIYRTPQAKKPHWLVKGGFGPFGMMNPDTLSGLWREDYGYDHPPAIGMVDVDADGILEVGYATSNSREFVCRDAWSGDVEWTVQLPFPVHAPCLSADADGDGKGEFLIGSFCLGTDQQGKGVIKWQSPVSMGWPAIADFDGDGLGEIACAVQGGVVLLSADGRKD